jgi:hypothetical protein
MGRIEVVRCDVDMRLESKARHEFLAACWCEGARSDKQMEDWGSLLLRKFME